MKYVTYVEKDIIKAGILAKDRNSVHAFIEANITTPNLLSFIQNHTSEDIEKLKTIENNSGTPLSEVKLLAPIPNPHHNIICVGLNYAEHVKESTGFLPNEDDDREDTVYFSKFVTQALGPDGIIESHTHLTKRLDYEAELAVVMGKKTKGIMKKDAWNYIFGLMCFNDISARDIQHGRKQWFFGKSIDTFTAYGPWITSIDEFTLPLALQVRSSVNGELRQNGNTSAMIFKVDEIIADLSQGITLDAGTIIATGTPAGVGAGFNPPKFMKPGDICEIEIEGCGVLINHVV